MFQGGNAIGAKYEHIQLLTHFPLEPVAKYEGHGAEAKTAKTAKQPLSDS